MKDGYEDKIRNLLDKIIATDYTKKDLKTFPNLNTIIEKSDINYLKTHLNQTDLILMPIALNLQAHLLFYFFRSGFEYQKFIRKIVTFAGKN